MSFIEILCCLVLLQSISSSSNFINTPVIAGYLKNNPFVDIEKLTVRLAPLVEHWPSTAAARVQSSVAALSPRLWYISWFPSPTQTIHFKTECADSTIKTGS